MVTPKSGTERERWCLVVNSMAGRASGRDAAREVFRASWLDDMLSWAGRWSRWMVALGFPKPGFTGGVKSTLVAQIMVIFGRQLGETQTVPVTVMWSGFTGVEDCSRGVRERRYTKVTSSFGRQSIGSAISGAVFRSSTFPSVSLKPTDDKLRELPAHGVASMSKEAKMQGLLCVLFGLA